MDIPRLLLTMLALVLFAGISAPAAAQERTDWKAALEEELAQRYAPVLYLKQQRYPCDSEGEGYLPAPVDVLFNDEAVVLRQAPYLTEVKRSITNSELYALDSSYYLDLPGRPRVPGCTYEFHAKQRMAEAELPPVVYAHIVREDGQTGIALQYWFFYYFNDFNDKHEGDWEGIQLLFEDANTISQALLRGPTRVAYAQHSGGEPAHWTDAKLDKEEETRPVVYVAAGSHASFYGPGVWIGWGKDGAGLGCDVTTGPWDRVTPEVRLIPNAITGPDDPFAWATFRGRWGERDTWVYNGPNGPNQNHRWTQPVTWQNGVLAGSIRLQNADVLGPQPTELFCTLVEGGSLLFTLAKPYPWAVGGGVAATLALIVVLVVVAQPIIAGAWSIYRSHFRTFFLIGSVLVPFTVLINGFLYALSRYEWLEDLLGFDEYSLPVRVGVNVVLTLQQVILVLVVTPAVIQAVGEIRAGREPTFRAAYRTAFARVWAVAGANLRAAIFTGLFAITLVGVPWAIMWGVRWMFVTQVIILARLSGRLALRASAAVVKDHWWRTVATIPVLLFVGLALGPLVGIGLLIGANISQDLTNAISSALYAVTYPYAVVGATLLYLRYKAVSVPAKPAVPARMPERQLATAGTRRASAT